MEIGKKLSGRYKIIGTVGGGGMANVYLAHDLILDRDVAVKVLRYDFREDQDVIRRFQREALSATELVHPNIVSVYDVGEEDNSQYIVMEYVKGTDLKKYIHNYFPIPYQKVIDMMEQILSAVADAHHNRIIHRDLKPQNILVDENGVVKITDFGIAVALSETSITQTNSLLGSVHYLSPEQARGSMATKQSDIYAMGIILYEMLTGSVPFEGESAVSIALKHFQETVPSVKDFDARIPQALENVVLKATAKEATDRYASAEEMASDLATSLSPQRLDEPKFEPASMLEVTRIHEQLPIEPPVEEKPISPSKEETTPDNEKKKKKKKKKMILFAILGIFLLAVIGFFAIALSAPKEVTIPDLSGMTESQAERELTKLKLKVGKITEEANEKIAEGKVIRSDPKEDKEVKENSAVDLFISSGKKTVKFGNYVGDNYQEVKAKLVRQGYKVDYTEESSDSVTSGSIISQDLDSDSEVIPSETTVSFVVSSGEQGQTLIDFAGYSKKGVQDYATSLGLKVTFTEEFSDEITTGQVISQEPKAGSTVYSGNSISAVISKGPKEVPVNTFTKSITVPYKTSQSMDSTVSSDSSSSDSNSSESSASSSSTITPNTIEIYIEDDEHSYGTVYQKLTITKDTVIDLTFKLKEGTAGKYKVVRDGVTILEDNNVVK
ncbi:MULTISPECIES: Stk1 family PASTA domain-containing Ser/Thr kinase [Carnobacterium]|uniref:Stk1 family PASTA domain-containing Ser/Thr kinase n=1 Tax=Carnobacterium TaxID=2747 RepID=UPI0028926B0C|nr:MULTISPECIES: Stk1 family PASTA domain-containing Ser/Thr kinase [Carnobacterium]MDT1938985.1 Stk1 family PASTA domain-containing Ser/Thr kinase [Carnobacterium divergens]MDT1941423.1 Stk1 family PASTA domain-containing Ser/Thr kinase [Carnobacterium divergens]MDT1947221.1 Stk1 family PASTA domain-containing Ser/Thr kinase [Carnobacterium divergens]MDT1949659.1 Stk1 family PASTA domain-containing Ser/Thr kinase [Carnobacterium divergens]MDT1954837.1 Stk1 family PASTA domain-containing Ser/T